jgi:hypothetical protein
MRSSSSRKAAASSRNRQAGGLNHRFGRTGVCSENQGHTNHALPPDVANLGSTAIREKGNHRNPATLGEVDRRNGFLGHLQDVTEGKLDRLQPGPEPGEILGRKSGQQAVARGGGRTGVQQMEMGHGRLPGDVYRQEYKPLSATRAGGSRRVKASSTRHRPILPYNGSGYASCFGEP